MFTKLSLTLATRRLPAACTGLRTYLSESYKCSQTWDNRLQAECMQKVNLDTLYLDIEQSFVQQGKPSVIDIDIFVNKLTDNVNSDEVSDLLHKLRLTEETSHTMPSTGHAVVRTFLENNYIDELINILDDRLNYGVFLDHYVANYLLDELVKRKDYQNAARVATMLMIQEDCGNEISQALGLHACWNYLEDPKLFYAVVEKEEPKKKKKDEIKIRLKFLRNEYFDDHFDLRDNFHLVGKTLSMIGQEMQSSPVAKNAQLLGEILYAKYDKAIQLLSETKTSLYKDVVLRASKHLEQFADDQLSEPAQQLKAQLQSLASDSSLNSANFNEELEKFVISAVAKCEKEEIAKQENVYKSWIELRNNKLQEEIQRLDRAKRLQQVEKMLDTMKTEEQKLWFFENEEKIDLQVDSKKVTYPKRWFGKKKKPRIVDEGYIPPEVRQKS